MAEYETLPVNLPYARGSSEAAKKNVADKLQRYSESDGSGPRESGCDSPALRWKTPAAAIPRSTPLLVSRSPYGVLTTSSLSNWRILSKAASLIRPNLFTTMDWANV